MQAIQCFSDVTYTHPQLKYAAADWDPHQHGLINSLKLYRSLPSNPPQETGILVAKR